MQANALPTPQPHQVTVREFFLMGEAGVLDPEAKIEIADSGVRYDRECKLPLYARFGIPEAWLIDIPAQAIWVYRQPENGAYQTSVQLEAPYRISPSMLDGLELELSDLL